MGDWRDNYPRKSGNVTEREPLTEWYKRKIDEVTSHEQFLELWDRQHDRRAQAAQAGQAGAQAPWQGITEIAQAFGINLGELWRTREEENKALRETADSKEKELHELRIREIDQRVQALQAIADKVTQALTQPQGAQGQPQSFLEKLDEATQGWLRNRFTAMLSGGVNQQPPQDPLDALIAHEEKRNRLRQLFSPSTDGSASAMAQSGIKGEILRMILEDDRERLRIDKEHDVQVERNKHLGELADVVKENLGDGIRALTMAAEEARGQSRETKQELQAYQCNNCGAKFTAPPEAQTVGCPNCGTIYDLKEGK